MKRRAFVHIGHGKTGTSAIQGFLKASPDLLKSKGLFYPQTGRIGDQHAGLAPLRDQRIPADMIDALRQELSDNAELSPILSSEFFYYTRPHVHGEIASVLAEFDVTIIMFVRQQINMISSAYLQVMRQNPNYSKHIWDFYKENDFVYKYFEMGDAIRRSFSRADLSVHHFDDDRRYDSVAAFAAIFGLEAKDQHERRTNTSIPSRLGPIIRLVNSVEIDEAVRQEILREAAKVPIYPAIESDFNFGEREKSHILQYYWPDNQRCAAHIADADERAAFLASVKP